MNISSMGESRALESESLFFSRARPMIGCPCSIYVGPTPTYMAGADWTQWVSEREIEQREGEGRKEKKKGIKVV